MKDIVFIPNIDLGNNRSNPYHYSIKSWQKWCDKKNIILFEWKNAILDTKKFPITFQRNFNGRCRYYYSSQLS